MWATTAFAVISLVASVSPAQHERKSLGAPRPQTHFAHFPSKPSQKNLGAFVDSAKPVKGPAAKKPDEAAEGTFENDRNQERSPEAGNDESRELFEDRKTYLPSGEDSPAEDEDHESDSGNDEEEDDDDADAEDE